MPRRAFSRRHAFVFLSFVNNDKRRRYFFDGHCKRRKLPTAKAYHAMAIDYFHDYTAKSGSAMPIISALAFYHN